MTAKPIDQLEFPGSIGNMPMPVILMNQFINALAFNGWREAHNAHFYKRLVERGKHFGITTPNDFARMLRNGSTLPARDGASKRVCQGGVCEVIFNENEFITIRHPGS